VNTDGTVFNTCKECHKTESLWNHTTTEHKEGEQLEDQRNVGETRFNFGFGTDPGAQSLMFMIMMTFRDNLSVPSRTRIREESRTTSWQDYSPRICVGNSVLLSYVLQRSYPNGLYFTLFIILRRIKPCCWDCRVGLIPGGHMSFFTSTTRTPTQPGSGLSRVNPFSRTTPSPRNLVICLSVTVSHSNFFNLSLPFECLPPFSISPDEVSFQDNTNCLLFSSSFIIYLLRFCCVQTEPYGNPGISSILL